VSSPSGIAEQVSISFYNDAVWLLLLLASSNNK